jgi:hypothetical protein
MAAHELMKAVPERRDGVILLGHRRHVLHFAVEEVSGGQQCLKALNLSSENEWS